MAERSELWRKQSKRIVLASIDEADPYEVDEAHIEWDGERFILKTAESGSNWDGVYDEEEFKTFPELETALVTADREWAPSLRGAVKLADDARKAAGKLGLRCGRRPKAVSRIISGLGSTMGG